MKKTAIFVEGQTELIFVREFLLKIFDFQNIDLECFNLQSGNENSTAYPFPNSNATHHFTIINAGNDDKVLKHLLKREVSLWNTGFSKIIALRDMFSDRYIAVNGRKIDVLVNQQFINGANEQVEKSAQRPENITFCYAIMETEAWFLGIEGWLTNIDARLTNDFIKQQLGFDLNTDPEVAYFHPATVLHKIYELADKKYEKTVSGTSRIVDFFDKNHFENLYKTPKCGSFNYFYDTCLKI